MLSVTLDQLTFHTKIRVSKELAEQGTIQSYWAAASPNGIFLQDDPREECPLEVFLATLARCDASGYIVVIDCMLVADTIIDKWGVPENVPYDDLVSSVLLVSVAKGGDVKAEASYLSSATKDGILAFFDITPDEITDEHGNSIFSFPTSW